MRAPDISSDRNRTEGTAAMTQMSPERRVSGCPPWCSVVHGELVGEEDWVHVSLPSMLVAGEEARLCASIDPLSGEVDGPYFLVGDHQRTLEAAEALGISVAALASHRPTPRQSDSETAQT